MYFVSVALLTVVLPVGSIWAELQLFPSALPPTLLIGKWFVFWAAGVRLVLAGLWQFFKPQYTLTEIFGIKGTDARPIVRELGVANFATGLTGMLSLPWPAFLLPVAIIAAIFYGVAGVEHARRKARHVNETIAMLSDGFVFAALAALIAGRVIGP